MRFLTWGSKKILSILIAVLCLTLASCNFNFPFRPIWQDSQEETSQANIYEPSGEYVRLENLSFAGWCRFSYDLDTEYVSSDIERYFNKYIAPVNTRKDFYIETARFLHVTNCMRDYYGRLYYDQYDVLDFRESEYDYNNNWNNEFNYGPTTFDEFQQFPDIDCSKSTKDIIIYMFETIFVLNERYVQSVNFFEYYEIKIVLEVDNGDYLYGSEYTQVYKDNRLCIEDYFRLKQELPEFNIWYNDFLYTIGDDYYYEIEIGDYLQINWDLKVYNSVNNTNYDVRTFVEKAYLDENFELPSMYDEEYYW